MNLDSLLRRAVGVGGLGLTAPDCDEGCGWDEETSQLAGDARTCEARDLSDYDQDQVLHRYGPVTIESDQLSFQGEAPMEVCVTATGAAPELAVALGDFGDGTIVEGLDACHTYTEDGRYAIQALLGWTEECGGYVHEPILWSIVTVCSEADGSCAGDTGEAGGQSTDCGCAATTGATAVGALAVLAAAIVRARRRGGPPFTS
jgi:uncharacterized protein (TIGR03382 family)